jgi:hypothetical protein
MHRNSGDNSATVCFEQGVGYYHSRALKEAIHCFNEAEADGFDPDLCASYRWKCWMLLGTFENAWSESDRIAARGVPDPHALWD